MSTHTSWYFADRALNFRWALSAIGLLWVFAVPAFSEPLLHEAIPIALITGARQLSDGLMPSPDGKLIAIVVANSRKQKPLPNVDPEMNLMYLATGVPSTKAAREIWIKDVATGALFQVNEQQGSNWGPSWSPDGNRLSFYSDLDGMAKLWLWDRIAGKAHRVTEAIARPWQGDDSPIWLDRTRLLTKFLPQGQTLEDAANWNHWKSRKTGAVDEETVVVKSQSSGPFESPFTQIIADLGVVDIETGKLRRPIREQLISSYSASPDGSFVAYDAFNSSDGSTAATVYSLKENAVKLIQKTRWGASTFAWSSDGRYLTGMALASQEGSATEPQKLDTHDWKFKPLAKRSDDEPAPPRWTEKVSGLRNWLTSYWTPLAKSGGLIFTSQDIGHLPDVWLVKNSTSAPEQLTHFNPELDRYAMGESTVVDWTDAQGRKLKGAVLLPVGYKRNKRYPMVVNCYGGRSGIAENTPKTAGLMSNLSPVWNYQALASRGYAVFIPEVPYGENSVMKDLADAVLPGLDRVVELGIADPQRLAIEGQSFGGYCVRALIVQTERFKAAISTAGAGGDAFVFYPFIYQQMKIKADPYKEYKDRDIFLRNSPIWFYNKVETPLLIEIGMNDGIGNNPGTYQEYAILRHLGAKVELLQYYGEDHVIAGYRNQIDFWNRRIAWLEKYLGSNRLAATPQTFLPAPVPISMARDSKSHESPSPVQPYVSDPLRSSDVPPHPIGGF